jgi:hypothetical protein
LDEEERELQIKLAQLNAKLQVNLAWTFGLFAAGVTLMVFGHQVSLENNFPLSIAIDIVGFASFVFAFGWIHRVHACQDEIEGLK